MDANLGLPQVHKTKNSSFNFRLSSDELERYKDIALRAGYLSVADLLRAGVILVEERLVQQ